MQAHLLTSIALSTNTLWVWICPFGWVSVGNSREVSPILFMITFSNIGTIKQKPKSLFRPSQHISCILNETLGTFNNYFVSQCTPLDAGDEVPRLPSKTPHGLLSITFSREKILNIIRALDSNKSSGWDGVSPRMIKVYDSSIVNHLLIIFETCIREGIFPDMWKMSNVCPIHKKESKNLKENYRPISLLPKKKSAIRFPIRLFHQ